MTDPAKVRNEDLRAAFAGLGIEDWNQIWSISITPGRIEIVRLVVDEAGRRYRHITTAPNGDLNCAISTISISRGGSPASPHPAIPAAGCGEAADPPSAADCGGPGVRIHELRDDPARRT